MRDATANLNATDSFADVGNVADGDGLAIDHASASGVFPIGANQTHQYDFQAVVDDNSGPVVNAFITMTAVYVPFNGAGAATALAALAPRAARANPAAARSSTLTRKQAKLATQGRRGR